MKETLRAAVVGLGSRGLSLLKTIQSVKDLNIVAVCDIMEDRLKAGVDEMRALGVETQGYTDYRRIIERGDIDLVYVVTNWITHWEICIDFMNAGIYTAAEVCGAASLDECWELVHTYERTKTPMMLLENCCYGRNELAVLNMVRQGVFGKVVSERFDTARMIVSSCRCATERSRTSSPGAMSTPSRSCSRWYRP